MSPRQLVDIPIAASRIPFYIVPMFCMSQNFAADPKTMEPLRYLERLHPRSLRHLNHYLADLVQGRLWLKVLIGMFVGLGTGVLLGPSVGLIEADLSQTIGNWLAFPGQLFLAVIQMLVIPLVLASIILGLASSENPQQLKHLGILVSGFFLLTTIIAAALGLALATALQPGVALSGKLSNVGRLHSAQRRKCAVVGRPSSARCRAAPRQSPGSDGRRTDAPGRAVFHHRRTCVGWR